MSRDVEAVGKMDPFVVCMYLGTEYKTGVHEGGGKTPAWNHTFDLPIGDTSDELHFSVKVSDVFTSELIGSVTIKTSDFCINNGFREWFTIEYEGEDAGQVLIESHFTPKH